MSTLQNRITQLSPAKLALLSQRLKEKKGVESDVQSIPRRDRSQPAPLSYAQQRLWLLDQLDPGNSAYNIRETTRRRRRLDISVLLATLNEVVRRHESLRTTFDTINGSAVQVVAPAQAIALPVVDLSALPEPKKEAQRLAVADGSRPFDLKRGPLFRATVLKLAEEDHLIVLTMHHIIFDGWSLGVLRKEVATLYSAFSQGLPSPLPELPVQYTDYAAWQREWLQDEVLEQQLGYWKRQLEGAPEFLELPADRPRQAVVTHRGGRVGMVLSRELTAKLHELCRAEDATTFMLLLAVFKVLLARYTGQEDIVVGTPIAGRNRVETEGLIGFFLNSLVLRTDLSGNPSARELIGRVREVALGAYAHQEFPFEKVIDELRAGRSLSHTPLFQVMFNMHNFPGGEIDLRELESSDDMRSKFDLTLYANDQNDGIQFTLDYNTDLFNRERIVEMLDQFENLLAQVSDDPSIEILQLSLVTPSSAKLLPEPAQPIPSHWSGAVHQLFAEQARKSPARLAVADQQETWTYEQIEERSNQLANYLRACGIQRGDVVAIYAHRSATLVWAIYGILKAGATFVILDPAYPELRLISYLRVAKPRGWLQLAEAGAIPPALRDFVETLSCSACLTLQPRAASTDDTLAKYPVADPRVEIAPDDIAYISFTSGSTGTPKGVLGRHIALTLFANWTQKEFAISEQDRFSMLSGLAHDPLQRDIFTPLQLGASLSIPDPKEIGTPGWLARWMKQEGISVTNLSPAIGHMLTDTAGDDELSCLRHAFFVGDMLTRRETARLKKLAPSVTSINLYGTTETQRAVSFFVAEPEAVTGAKEELPVGRGIDGVQLLVLNAAGQLAGIGELGEIYFRSPYLALGYHEDDELTQQRFITNPFTGVQDDRLYKTGDIGRYLPDGNVEMSGRMDHQVKIRGFRIELGEIESAIAKHPAVQDCAVLAREDEPGDKRLVAYVVCKHDGSVTTAELRRTLKKRLPDYMVPAHFVVLDELPLTPNGKLNRLALPVPVASRDSLTQIISPRTPVEEVLAGIWCDVLRTTAIGIDDNFFELGGHSLLATQVVSRVREAFGLEVPMRAIFENPTIAMLATEVEQTMYQGGSLHAPPVVRTSREVELPLSFAQQRLWFIDRFEPASPLYNTPMAVRLDGALKLDALVRTLREIVRRHEVLRTNFVTVEGKPVQVIRPEAYAEEFGLPLVDLSSLPGELRKVEAKRLAQAEAARPFDLAAEALMRPTVLRLDDQQHIALLTLHHIVSDGWSMGLFVKEVAALYNAFSQGLASPLAELPVQYADYAVWQRGWLQGEVLDQQIGYWKQQLEGAPELLELPADRPRPAVQTHRGAKVGMVLSKKLTAKVRELCRAEGATLFMLLLAVFKVLLARYTGQEDISVGTPIAGRNRMETEGLIGFFVNTLVMRTDLSGNPTARELLRRVREVALGAYAHQELPFEKLVEELQVERSLRHTPLFQVLFVLQNTTEELLELPGLKLSAAGAASGVAKFDLTLTMSESGEAISGMWEYNTGLFDEATIQRMLSHFQTLLEATCADPDTHVQELPLLSAEESRHLLCDFNPPAVALPPAVCLHQLFEAQADSAPEALALSFDGFHLSYGKVNERANRLAHHLRSLGVGPEHRVGVLLDRTPELVIAILGILKAGAAYLPLDPGYPQERLSYMLADAGARVVVTEQALVERWLLDSQATLICLDDQVLATAASTNPAVGVKAENAAYVIYTSGSTGQPKGVVVTHENVWRLLEVTRADFAFDERDVWTLFHSVCFDFSVWELWGPWAHGGRLVVVPYWVSREPEAFYELLKEEQVTVLNQTPSAFRQLLKVDETVGSELALRVVIFGGEALEMSTLRGWFERHGDERPRLVNMYGITETTVHVTYRELSARDTEGGSVIGGALGDLELYVLDQQMQAVPEGVTGELYVGGNGVARGYLGRAELTAQRFVPHPYSERAGARLYRTGDLARRRTDGELEYVGRMDEQVKIRGFRIELGEIANALQEQAGVRECVVLALEENGAEKRIVAYVVADEGVNTGELREELKQRLPEYMIPPAIVLLAEMPLTRNGKVDRRALPAPAALSAELETNFLAPRTPVEEVLAGIWSDVLRTARIGVNDNFFELGGHSLLATQVVSRIREAFSIEIPVRSIFEKQTLAMLAVEVEQLMYQGGGSPYAPPVVRTSRKVELPLSFAQQRLWFIDRLTPESPLYNMPFAVRLDGALNLAALERTLREIVRRHEVLRTNFVTVEGKPVQVIRPEANVEEIYLPLVDLSALPEALREVEAKRLARAEAVRSFDLEADALLRMTVLRLDEQQHIALLTLHHIIFDGWSMGVLVREVASLYSAFSQGLESPLTELPVQYADYAVWQQEWLQGEVLEQQIGYWKQQLEGAPELLELPADRSRPAVQTHRGADVGIVLSKELMGKLRELCRAEGATLFMLLLATFKVLLGRYTGQEDISVGTPIAGRNRVETEGLIGFFVNTLVLRTDLSGKPTMRELIRRVREVALGAYAHQELPFEKLVDELQVERSLSHTPLFQVAFALQNATQEVLELPGLSLRAAGEASAVAKFDLTLSLSESGEAISGALQYNTGLFEAATIKRMVMQFQMLLESIIANPNQSISSLPLLAESERQVIFDKWNDTERPFPSDLCVHQLFEAQVLASTDAIALIFNDVQLSYRELNERANQLARHLRRLGVGVESTVAILMERSADLVVSLLAILKAGGYYLPLDPDYPQERLSFMLRDADARIVLTQQHLLERLPEHDTDVVLVDADWPAIEREQTENLTSSAQAENVAYVIYTSGSTGEPKGVAVTHRNVARLLFGVDYVCLADRPRILQLASISFDASTFEVWGALLQGGCCVLYPERVPSHEGISALIARHQIEVMFITTALFNAVVDEAPQALSGIRQLLVGGEALSVEHIRRAQKTLPGVELTNIYGPTESTTFACHHRIEELKGDERGIAIGRAIGNTQAYILDSEMEVAGVGVKGELYLGGEGLARGYLKRASLTAERFVPHPFSERAGERLYRTGDVCRYREDGAIEYVGRMDQQVKLRGFRIELGEIETVLAKAEGIREAVVVVREQAGEKRLVAYVVGELNASDMREYLGQRLPDYMIPGAFVVLAEMPITANGKVDKKRLPEPMTERPSLASIYVEPQTETERTIAVILKDLLRLSEIGTEDNFFDLGGHSLLATQVVSHIREAFGVELPVRAIFEKPTMAMLAVEVEQLMYQGGSLQAPPVVRSSHDVELPLSFAQQRLWFIDRLTPESPLYNVPMAVRLDGALNLDALEWTLREIVRRHEVLRTNIVTVEGKPVQMIRPEAQVDEIYLPLVDLSSLPGASREVEAKRLAQAEAARPFDLAADVLLRMTVLRLDDQQHIALLTLHHIIFDGWSMGVLVREVASLYSAFSQGLESPLADLPVQYADYAVWQREWLQGEVLEQQISYWKQQLEGAPALLELPADRPRPVVQTHRGARVGMALSPELTAKVRELCRAEGTTLFMLLLAVFKVLLGRYTGQEDISVGTPIAGRNRVETEGLIGFFVNTLVLRTDLSGNPTARELLRRVREVALGAYAHQELPFEKLVDELQVERSLSHTPLFQVLFVLQNTTEELLELPGLSLRAAGAASAVAKFDLTLSLSESGEAISGTLEYNTDLFDETTIKRLVGHFKILLESFVSDPALSLSQLQMLTNSELQRTLYEWSEVKDEAPAAFEVSECLHDLFEAQVKRTPDAIAVVFDEQQISYRELNSRANQLAHHLQSAGMREESLVGILVERSVEMLAGILGVLKAGAAYLPLDPTYPQERLSFMLEDAGVEVLLTQQHLIERFASASLEARPFQTLCLDRDWTQIAEHSTNNPARRSVASNAAYVIYTSGSTGKPKGVVVTHASVVNLAATQSRALAVRPGTRVLQCASLSFDISVWEIFVTLLNGATLCVPKPETQLAGAALYELLQQQSIELVLLTPTVLATLESEGLPCLRTVLSGAEACAAELAARWSAGRCFINAYGPTEITVMATMSEALDGERLPPIGRPIANLQAYVLDRYMQPVAVGVTGELYVGGAGVTRGYLHLPELTAEKFVPHPFSLEAGARLYRTGDFARYLADGQLEYVGRIDEQVKLRGLRIELNEIKAVLLQHESVREAVVVVRADESGERKLVAYLVTQDDAESQTSQPTTSELRRHAKQFLPEYMVPSTFLLLESLPVIPAGKVDKKRLPAPTNERPALASPYVKPQTETEQSIAAVWQELLHLSEVGTEDNFFDLGGNSLLLMQVSARLQNIFAEQLTIVELFAHPTIGSLAARLSHEVPSLAQGQRQAARLAKKMTRNERRRQKLEQHGSTSKVRVTLGSSQYTEQ